MESWSDSASFSCSSQLLWCLVTTVLEGVAITILKTSTPQVSGVMQHILSAHVCLCSPIDVLEQPSYASRLCLPGPKAAELAACLEDGPC